uniref:Uncharacterized protein n=1 Tax=Chromera velia CCMP2878 TaxID=1169474 RepID=A0A0G4I455_9ALVE|eukprot:Cvel_10833.t1-p1 / transcript=Cvel_10833.t1 / gene=Cvel_10833 / organism=Chromera_velia_CCMP2878 / gene_product=hypothetical protein / transcript_product=hypothetical protein / location=Cvel_scaffold662:72638-73798(+) / protein_length=387 / sequence_SO=supercontig / SO=protein_coding / is_pseudo=false
MASGQLSLLRFLQQSRLEQETACGYCLPPPSPLHPAQHQPTHELVRDFEDTQGCCEQGGKEATSHSGQPDQPLGPAALPISRRAIRFPVLLRATNTTPPIVLMTDCPPPWWFAAGSSAVVPSGCRRCGLAGVLGSVGVIVARLLLGRAVGASVAILELLSESRDLCSQLVDCCSTVVRLGLEIECLGSSLLTLGCLHGCELCESLLLADLLMQKPHSGDQSGPVVDWRFGCQSRVEVFLKGPNEGKDACFCFMAGAGLSILCKEMIEVLIKIASGGEAIASESIDRLCLFLGYGSEFFEERSLQCCLICTQVSFLFQPIREKVPHPMPLHQNLEFLDVQVSMGVLSLEKGPPSVCIVLLWIKGIADQPDIQSLQLYQIDRHVVEVVE